MWKRRLKLCRRAKKTKIKSDYLKTWLFRKKLVVHFRDDLFIFKLKRVFRAFETQFFFALAYTNSRYALGAKHAMERFLVVVFGP